MPRMGLRDYLTGWAAPETFERASTEDAIDVAISERMASFSMSDALDMPSVRRGVDLITTVGASLEPVCYQDGTIVPTPPLIARPDPFRSRYEWTLLVLRSLLGEGNGNAYIRLGETAALVLDPSAVYVTGADTLTPRYRYGSATLTPGVDILHLRIGQRVGMNKGESPLGSALDYLAILDATERYAQTFFESNGTPHTILTTDLRLTGDEAASVRDAYLAARAAHAGVATLSTGYDAKFPTVNPENAQLTDSRNYGNTLVSRLLGIPGPLMLTEGTGGSLTYTNVSQLIASFARQTVLPMYMAGLEAALSDLLPRGMMVRYSVGELTRVDVQARLDVYERLLAIGIVDREAVASSMGLDPRNLPKDLAEVPASA